jgi:uncharacterized membrane protein
MSSRKRNVRFVVAVIAAAVTIFLLITFNSFVYYSIAPSGDWVSMYRSPLETMLSTIIAMLLIVWLYGWYRRDRVQRAMSGLDADERARLLDLLLDERLAMRTRADDLPKRKRDASSYFDKEISTPIDEIEALDSRRVARR